MCISDHVPAAPSDCNIATLLPCATPPPLAIANLLIHAAANDPEQLAYL